MTAGGTRMSKGRQVPAALIVFAGAWVAMVLLLTALLALHNPEARGLIPLLETAAAMGWVVFLVHGVFAVLLVALRGLVRSLPGTGPPGGFPAFLAAGLIGLDLVWVLWNRLAMVHQWISVRPFVTWAGIGQSLALALLFGLVLTAPSALRRKGAARSVHLLAPMVLVALLLAWNAGSEGYERRYAMADIRVAASAASAAGERADPGATPGEEAHSPAVFVLGIDGASWQVMVPLMRAGRLPALAGLVRRGSIGYLDNGDAALSPEVWTTLFSGRAAADHGVYVFRKTVLPRSGASLRDPLLMRPTTDTFFGLSHLLERLPGSGLWEMRMLRSTDRRVPMVWDVASRHGRRVVVVNELLGYPVHPVDGAMVMLSDRADPQGLDAWPRELSSRWRPTLLTEGGNRTEESFGQTTRRMHAEAAWTETLVREVRPDLAIYYTRFLDRVVHANWDFYARDRLLLADLPSRRSTAEWERLVLDHLDDRAFRAYEEVDRVVARFAGAFAGATFLVVSDHGWTYSGYEHYSSPDGVLIASGPLARLGADLDHATVESITPTLLAMLGVPLSRELAAGPLSAAMTGGHEGRLVESYGPPPELDASLNPAEAAEREAEQLEDLRGLGYVK